jgi:hypothetical protein
MIDFSRNSDKKYRQIAHLMKSWLEIAANYAKADCATHLSIYLYLTPFRKNIGEEGVPMDIMQINTASTNSCMAENAILIFRMEEWFKVFIHETFHNLGLDFSAQNIKPVQQSLMRLFKIRSEMRIYETYCEVWADILNVLFTQDANWIRALQEEREFSFKQAGKIFQHFGLTYSELGTTKATTAFNENTEVFCYFIMRSLWMWNLNRFLEWCLEHNRGSLRFRGNVAAFVNHMGQNPTQEYLEAVRPIVSKNLSLRMTAHG